MGRSTASKVRGRVGRPAGGALLAQNSVGSISTADAIFWRNADDAACIAAPTSLVFKATFVSEGIRRRLRRCRSLLSVAFGRSVAALQPCRMRPFRVASSRARVLRLYNVARSRVVITVHDRVLRGETATAPGTRPHLHRDRTLVGAAGGPRHGLRRDSAASWTGADVRASLA